MKKLKLKALKIGAKELLSREQLKNVFGGSGSGDGGDGGSGDDGGSGGENPKRDACVGKKAGDACSWTWQGYLYAGHCKVTGIDYHLHCSDLP